MSSGSKFDDVARAWTSQGYDLPFRSSRPPDQLVPPHTHPFTSRVAVLSGSLTIRVLNGGAITYHAGQQFLMPRDSLHEELSGPAGAALLIASRRR